VQGANWAASFTNVGATTVLPSYVEVQTGLQPFVSDRAAYGEWSLVDVWSNSVPSSNNFDIGTVQYNNPYPSSWLQVFGVVVDASDVNNAYGGWNGYTTTTAPSSGFTPLMSPVQNPTMNGASLFTTGLSSNTTSVTLSWTAPPGVSPYGYEINYYCADSDSPQPANCSGLVYTSSTSVTLPPGLLAAGYNYQFDITAMADSRANIATSPWRSGYPQAWADVISAPLSINPNAQLGSIRGKVAVAAHQGLIRTKNGNFMITKSGQKPVGSKARMLARFHQNRILKVSKSGSAVSK
jgi:hypothetical protein